ncbi:dihydrofolate reductase family protein [Vagococcus acidifermentans]|uniref:Deaminase n=1 Tax=Vagococcus acidifermentans TaxID=564710 RepID=A0A430APH3_9ENTE|nr:dihydrofolate reductase family protein [Vagococcus acidifermentans]RSU09804.1 deaminase [Vagococcus acidifermentans]
MSKPITTLFLLTSVDGKITSGSSDELDFDKDFPTIEGVKEGLQQYYDIEKTTDLWSLCSGRVQAKLGVNSAPFPEKGVVSFVLIDNYHLTKHGIQYFSKLSKNFVLITKNKNHPAFTVEENNLNIILQEKLNLTEALSILKEEFKCERLTIQTGGTLNALLLREDLIDYVDIVVAPILVGGKDTSSLIDGESITSQQQLNDIKPLALNSVSELENSYIRLHYKVLNER